MIFKQLFKTVVLLLTATVIVACSGNDDAWSPWESHAELKRTIVGYDETTLVGATHGDPRYTYEATIVEGNDWCSFSKGKNDSSTNGIVGGTFTLYLDVNTSNESRTAAILVKYGGNKYSTLLEFEQLAMSQNSSYDRSWGEQPAMKEANNFIYKTYYTTTNGRSVRNFSICYDTE